MARVPWILIQFNSEFFVHFLIVDVFSLTCDWIYFLVYWMLHAARLRLFFKFSEFFNISFFFFGSAFWRIAFLKRSKARLLIWLILINFGSLYPLEHFIGILWSISCMALFLIWHQVFRAILMNEWSILFRNW